MVIRFFNAVRAEVASYSRAEKLFILFAMLTGFCMTGEYALTKPTANSMFIDRYGADFYPYVWLATVPFNLFLVWVYNRFVAKMGCMRMLAITAGAGLGINVFCSFHLGSVSWLPFAFYLWKDVYILIMLQQLWSVIHATVSKERAKYLYGIIFGVGGLGSIMGSLVPTLFATQLGSEGILLFNVPLYVLVALFYGAMLKVSKSPKQELPKPTDKSGGIALIRKSRRLQFILLIVVMMQIAANVLDYQFNHFVSQAYPDCDLRTQFYGQFWGIIHTVNLCLQFVGSFLLVQLIGLKRSHLLVPTLLLINSAAFLALPTLAVMCVAFGTIKAFDYSLFAILKEMLYVPLRAEEKFKAKAVIDVFAYRASKALASGVVLVLQFVSFAALSWAAAALFSIWVLAAFFLKEEPKPAKVVGMT